MKTTGFIEKRILITVKTYPVPSFSYGETVCSAGIDLDGNSWIRLYPIPFRDLGFDKRFRKYCIINAKCAKANDDHRPESFRIQSESIEIRDHLGTENGWSKRKAIILSAPGTNLCRLQRDQAAKGTSLGLVEPASVSFEFEKRPRTASGKRERAYAMPGLFDRPKAMIEEIPYIFYFRFFCKGEKECPGHRLSIIDWEIGQAYRKWRDLYGNDADLLKNLEKKWADLVSSAKRMAYFYVGNLHRFQDQFVILGVFAPPR